MCCVILSNNDDRNDKLSILRKFGSSGWLKRTIAVSAETSYTLGTTTKIKRITRESAGGCQDLLRVLLVIIDKIIMILK